MNSFGFLARLYRSSFLPYKEDGIEHIKYFLPENGTGIDIGANIGRFTRVLAGLVGKKGLILSIEPLIYPRKILSSMVFINRLNQVKILANALSNKEGKAFMNIPLIITLDYLVQEMNLRDLNFIKCDVEGLELEVFKGAKEAIEKFKPTIFCEVTENFYSANGRSSSIFFKLMSSYGYKIFFPFKGKLKKLDKTNKLPTSVQDYFFISNKKINSIDKKLFL